MKRNDLRVEELSLRYVQDVLLLEQSLPGSGDEESIKNTISDEFLKYYVLLDGENVIGFLEGKIILGEAELYDICIKSEQQGKGYANFLMEFFLEKTVKCGCNTIFLEVNTMNYKAISLYHKFGFVEYGIRKNYYGNSDAILMKKVLN